uniref:HORMA domain-containing protein n=1 Tax=Sinocyclocheilus rhinocerous TaxID=307959 RepID=A0A673GM81_9TELE
MNIRPFEISHTINFDECCSSDYLILSLYHSSFCNVNCFTMQVSDIIALDTKAQSLVFVKRMVVIAVSSITYLRGIFPEDSYRSRYLEDLCIKVLKQDCSCPEAHKLVKW